MPSQQYRIHAAAVLAGLACRSATPPGNSPAAVPYSAETVPGISVTVRVERTEYRPGDTVRFVVTAFNVSTRRVQIGQSCGPSFDVEVTMPSGARRSVLSDLVGPDEAYTCQRLPEHFVEPGGTQRAELRWQVPAARGRYSASAGLRRGDGLSNLSSPIEFSAP